MRCKPSGPSTARIMIVGEAPGEREEQEGVPFVGASGYELKKMLTDARINIEECYLTNVCMDRPKGNDIGLWINPKKANRDGSEINYRGAKIRPHIKDECERLYTEIRAVSPNLVIALGNAAVWALTDAKGIGKWRGSILESDALPGVKVIPAYHPTQVLKVYDWRFITVQDFRRAAKEALFPEIRKPKWNFITDPTYEETVRTLHVLLNRARDSSEGLILVTDVEIKRTEILCVGLAWSKLDAVCIPFYHDAGHRWTPEEHVEIVLLLQRLMCHPNVRLVNQNISFDIQYFFWRFNFWPRAYFDTMLGQNILFPSLPKKLDFLASMYCTYYRFWKDDKNAEGQDGKFWKDGVKVHYPSMWYYNCEDCVYTYEIMEVMEGALKSAGLESQAQFQMRRLFHPAMKMMLRGVAVNVEKKNGILKGVGEFCDTLRGEVEYLTGRELTGPGGGFSPQRLQTLFYRDMGFKPITNRLKGIVSITCDDEALKKLAKIDPIVAPICHRINMVRSYKTALDACSKRVDKDGRWRTSYNLAGTETFRWSSSENPFGSGINLQNLTIGKDIL